MFSEHLQKFFFETLSQRFDDDVARLRESTHPQHSHVGEVISWLEQHPLHVDVVVNEHAESPIQFSVRGSALDVSDAPSHLPHITLGFPLSLVEHFASTPAEHRALSVTSPLFVSLSRLKGIVSVLESQKASFVLRIMNAPFMSLMDVRVGLGFGSRLESSDFTAAAQWNDLRAVAEGKIKWSDLLFGRLQIDGDMTQAMQMALTLMEG